MPRLNRPSTVVAAALSILGACSPAAQPSLAPTSAPAETVAPTAGGAEATPAPTFAGTKEFTIAYPSAYGFSDAPLRAAIGALNAQGWKIFEVELAASELGYQGVAGGQFQMTSGATVAGMRAAQAQKAAEGQSNIKIIVDRSGNEWILSARKSIMTCADLNGKKLAIHSEGAVSTAMVRSWINDTCPGTQPEYVIISGSGNRLAAMLAGQLDATPLELADAIALENQAADDYGTLLDFAAALPELRVAPISSNAEFIAQNPDTIRAFVKAVVEEFRKSNADPAYLEQIVNEYIPGLDPEAVKESATKYIELKLFDPNGGFTDEVVQYSIDFFTNTGDLEPGLTVEDVSDLTALNSVLDEIGRE